jgi:ATP-binding cassette subfamily F protein 3
VVAPATREKDNATPAKPAAVASGADRREQKRREAAERQRLSAARKPIESRTKRVEEQMAKLNARKAAIEGELADPAVHAESNRETLKALILDQAYVERELSQLEAEWLGLQEQLEQLETT